MKRKSGLRKALKIGAICAGLFGLYKGEMCAIETAHNQHEKAKRWKAITKGPQAHFDLSKLDKENATKIQHYLDVLKTVPEMNKIFANLPANLQIIADTNDKDSHRGGFNPYSARIFIDLSELASERDGMNTLAHELCHANQECGLLGDDSNENMTFEERFRVSKLGELEAWLLGTMVESRLHKMGVLSEEKSVACETFDTLSQELGPNMARDAFVVLHWRGGDHILDDLDLSKDFIELCDGWYQSYNLRGLNAAHECRESGFSMGGHFSAQEVADMYVSRMDLSLDPEALLNGDNVRVNEKDGSIDVLHRDGSKDHITYEKKGKTIVNCCERFDCTGETTGFVDVYHGGVLVDSQYSSEATRNSKSDWSRLIKEIHEEKTDLGAVKSILKRHPNFINRQAVFGWTPIMLAIQEGNDEIAQFFMKRGANLLVLDEDGRSVMDHLDKYGQKLEPKTQQLIKNNYTAQEKLRDKSLMKR